VPDRLFNWGRRCLLPRTRAAQGGWSWLPLPFLTQPGRVHTAPQQTRPGRRPCHLPLCCRPQKRRQPWQGPARPARSIRAGGEAAVKSGAGPHAHPSTLSLAAEAGSGSGVPESASIAALWLSSEEGWLAGALATSLLSCSACPRSGCTPPCAYTPPESLSP